MKIDRITKLFLGLIATGLWVLVILLIWPQAKINIAAKAQKATQVDPKNRSVDYDSLTVHRLNVVNKKGQLQWVIADSNRFPPPILDGKVYKGARSISPTGVTFYDYHGNERGGISYSNTEGYQQNAMILDYQNSDGMGFGIQDNRPDSYNAGFFINDPVPLDENITERKGGSVNTTRALMRDKNGNASIILRDKQGNNRIKLEVTKDGHASIQVLDASGKVVSRLPGK